MRWPVLATAATLAILAVGSLVPNRAEATTVTTPIGIQAAIDGTNLVQDIALVCQRRWRCGHYGCGWGRVCWRTAPGPYYYGDGPYGRPYYRRYWW
jgi:hypothetical protein